MALTRDASTHLRARITSQGQVTVPKAVRDRLGAKPGDDLTFEATEDGFLVRSQPRVNILDFAGAASASAHGIPTTAEELDQVISTGRAEEALARDLRIREAVRRPPRCRAPR
jgi:AbrB family looped-hinge helix DNA binding protein